MASTSDVNKFTLNLDAFVNSMYVNVAELQKTVAFDLFARIVKKTPKRTGRAQSSWTMAVNRVDRTVKPAGRKSYPPAKAPAVKNKVGDTIWISNNLPYIESLEQGRSRQQAPHGMVAISIEEVKSQLEVFQRVIVREGAS